MSVFNAGALVWKIQTVGAEILRRDLKDAQEAFDKTGEAAAKAGKKVSESGTATDKASESARKTKKPLDEQAEATRKAAEEAAKAEKAAKEHAAALEKQRAAAQQLANAMMIAGAAVAAMVTLAVVKHTEFDQAMSNTSAAIMATREEQELLAESALQAGADTAYSATEAAAAQEELAKAGMSVTSVIKGGLNGALSLAAAGQLAVARSAEIMATTLTQFQLPASKAAHVADLLAAGAGKAQGSVEDMGLALSYVGPLANSVGWSIEETAGTIAYFATQGIIGEKAGTALRGVMAGLQAPSAAAQKVMDQYGITVYDASGKMLSASGIAEQFRTKLGDLTDQERQAAMGRIFGNESLLAATLLYQGGADAIDEWTENVSDAGYAAEQAAMRQDNLAGDIEKLGGSFETVLIKLGGQADDAIRGLVQGLTELVDGFGEADEGTQALYGTVGIATAAIALLAGGTVTARTKFIALKATLDTVGASFTKTAFLGAAAGLALTGVIAVVANLMAAHAEGEARARSYGESLNVEGKATEETFGLIADKMLEVHDGWDKLFGGRDMSGADAVEKLGMNLEDVVRITGEGGREFSTLSRNVNDLMTNADGAADVLANKLGISTDEVQTAAYNLWMTLDEENKRISEGRDGADAKAKAMAGVKKETEETIPVSQTAAEAYFAEAEAIEAVRDELDDLLKKLFETNDTNRDAITASNDYKSAIREIDEVIRKATEGIDENGDGLADHILTLDGNTDAGARNMEMLIGLAEDTEKVALATARAGGSQEELETILKDGHQAIVDRAMAFEMTAEEAHALADEIAGIPEETAWKLYADTETAMDKINQFIIDASGKRINIRVDTHAGTVYSPQGTSLEFYADGGHRVENHVAQMARGGNTRIWNEPETGGETYIPHAPEKRAKSTQILAETADLFGYDLVPRGAPRFADGGVSPQVAYADRAPEPRGGVNINIVNPIVRDLMEEALEAAQLAGVMLGI